MLFRDANKDLWSIGFNYSNIIISKLPIGTLLILEISTIEVYYYVQEEQKLIIKKRHNLIGATKYSARQKFKSSVCWTFFIRKIGLR